ncbi:MAG: helix-turn-helix transcriptional regulator [Actinomycetota bacterium]
MSRLRERDYRGVLAVLLEADAVEGPWPFSAPVLESMRELIPCHMVWYHERRAPGSPATTTTAGAPRRAITADVREANRRYVHLDPLVPWEGARRITDVVSRREWRRSPLYNEVDRPMGVEHMMRLWVEPLGPSGARIELDRGDRDFSERDRAVLDLMLPHLRQLRRRAARRRRTANSADVLTSRQREVLTLVARGMTNEQVARTLWIATGTVRKHLDNAYEKLGVGSRAAAVAAICPEHRSG